MYTVINITTPTLYMYMMYTIMCNVHVVWPATSTLALATVWWLGAPHSPSRSRVHEHCLETAKDSEVKYGRRIMHDM